MASRSGSPANGRGKAAETIRAVASRAGTASPGARGQAAKQSRSRQWPPRMAVP